MATHHRGSEAECRALDAYVKLVRAAESVSARLAVTLDEAGLTPSQFGILEALWHLGPLSQCDLARKILKSGGNVTVVVDNLERQGRVRRERDRADRRYVTVHLTDDGRRLMEEVFPRHVERVVAEFAVLQPEEQALLGALCRRLGLGEGAECRLDAPGASCPEEASATTSADGIPLQ